MDVVSLGLAHEEDMIEPQVSFQSDVRPIKICGGGNFTALLLENGLLYVAGEIPFDVDLQQTLPTNQNSWVHVPGQFTDVACGWAHIVVVDQNGIVFTAGAGDKGELGQSKVRKSPKFAPILSTQQNSEKAQVFACFYNTYILSGGILYGCGSNTKCQLQNVKSRAIDTLEIISPCSAIVSACVGKNFVCFVEKSGNIHIRGALSGYKTQIQQQSSGDMSLDLKAMWTSITSLDGQKFSFYGSARLYQNVIAASQFEKPVTAWNTGSEHGIACVDKKAVFCWGWGEHGNCGPIATTKAIDGINDGSNINSNVNLTYDANCHSSDATVYACFGGCATTWICIEYK
ncbi:Ats1p LALA0_S09e07316g [Lachancea lanzarotensis]|uniref:LALA0S09e07316g1_1 n=1 Tax=Lachancea lanzarotensis TaxID=1245769 RepID=A0A0C7N7Z0_9SACH|nr:uncharacterized protein LALA0_S09e07316g [Lachancea lanzarotensis]CEP63998.1 LALA0S09e07316g1_1 [Lachancea lanzarotensis]